MVRNLKRLRTEAGYSQQQLAERIGVSQQSVNKYENSSVEPDISTLIALADLFGVSVDYLIGRVPEPAKPAPERFPSNYQRLTTGERQCLDALLMTYLKNKNAAAK